MLSMSIRGRSRLDPATRMPPFPYIAARRHAEKTKRLSEAQWLLHMAAQIGRLGAWSYEVSEDRVTWSEEVCAIHEVKQGHHLTAIESLEFYAPAYRRGMRRLLKTCLDEGTPFDVETQVVTAKGRQLWTRIICEAEWDAQGKVRRLLGACQDITEAKRAAEDAYAMAKQLTNEILRLNAELEERVRQRTSQLQLANRELEAFSYSIAHDLRAPLSSIDGFSRALEQSAGDGLNPTSQRYLKRVRAGVRQMAELTDGLLALSSLSQGELIQREVDLAGMAASVVASLREQFPARRVDVAIESPLAVVGDPRLLQQVMANLLGNAWKFTGRRPHARIEVGALPRKGGAVYYVRDNGAGFDLASASRLFQAFHRMHSAKEFEGNGIGLAIVQKIVLRHGGLVWAESEPEAGATFYFTLAPQVPVGP